MSARGVLDRWQALADGATEGPWVSAPGDQWVHAPHLVEQDEATEVADVLDFRRDAEFIAAARTIVPAAVKALRDVLDELDEWERAGHLSIEMVHIRRAIEAAIGGEGR